MLSKLYITDKTRQVDWKSLSSQSNKDYRLSAQHFREILDKLKDQKHTSSTKKMYYGVWKNFNKFIVRLDQIPENWEEKIALYCAYLIEDCKVQSCTLKSYVSAIKSVLSEDGHTWKFEKVLLAALVKACKLRNDTLKNRLPIKRNLLEVLLIQLENHFRKENQVYLEILYKTAFILAYYGLFRIGELTESPHVILARNVFKAQENNKFMLVLYSSKTHTKADRPQKIKNQPNHV